MAININKIVSVTTSVISGAIAQPALITNFLTNNILVPAGGNSIVQSFTTPTAVGQYFGTTSDEYAIATNYFLGYNNSATKPQQILFSSYPTSAVAAYMFSQQIVAPTTIVAKIKALTSPAMVCHINGTTQTLVLAQSDFTSATGLTDIASVIQTKLSAILTGCTCTVIGQNQFKIQAPSTGASTSTITYATGNVAVLMGLDTTSNPTLSQGTAGGNASFNMTNILAVNNNWIALSYVTRLEGDTIDDDYAITVDLSSWIASQVGTQNYIGLWWEGGTQPKSTSSTTSLSAVLVGAGYGAKVNGQVTFNIPIQVDYNGLSTVNSVTTNEIGRYSAFVGGMGASINYTLANAKINFAGKQQTGLAVNVSNDTDYTNLLANGYNVYGGFASRTTAYNFTETGSVGGDFKWLDNVYDAVWLSNQIADTLATLIQSSKRIPYNNQGIQAVTSVLSGVAQAGATAGVIETGNTFNQIEIQTMIELVGVDISSIMTQNGYYIYVAPVTADMRINRSTLPVYFIYTNGGAINSIAVNQVFVA